MQRDISVKWFFPHPPEKVWECLTGACNDVLRFSESFDDGTALYVAIYAIWDPRGPMAKKIY